MAREVWGVRQVAFVPKVRMDLDCFRPEFLRLVWVFARTAPPLNEDVMMITSVSEGRHGENSRHFVASGLDVRFVDIQGQPRPGGIVGTSEQDRHNKAREWRDRAQKLGGPGIQIVQEGDHLHGELDW